MQDIICYKIQNAYWLSYEVVTNGKRMDEYERSIETIASARIYFICRIKQYAKPEVLYVGETFNKKRRFRAHKRLRQAKKLLQPDECLRIYFIHTRFLYVGLSQFQNDPLSIFNDIKDLYSKTSMQLQERIFIKLFKPPLNKQCNNRKIKEDRFIQKKLIDNFIEYVHLDIGMNEYDFNFTGGLRIESEDQYTYCFKNNTISCTYPMFFS